MTVRPWLLATLRLAARLSAAAGVLVLAAIPFALVLLRLLHNGRLAGIDGRVADRLHDFASRSSRAARLATLVTDFGHWRMLTVVVALATVALLALRRRRDVVFLLTTAIGGVVIDAVLKAVVQEARTAFVERVKDGLDKSFPSGHAMNSAFVYGALAVVALRWLTPAGRWLALAAAGGLVTAICASRVALGLHYISDVVGGVAFGVAWLGASVWAFSRWRHESAGADSDVDGELAASG